MLPITYEKLKEYKPYLERINYGGSIEPNLENLHALIYAHQTQVPFENLDVYDYHREISLDIENLYDKVVKKRRGGYCFELNALFLSLLLTLGYEAYACPSRVVKGRKELPAITHRGTIVKLEGKSYYADVGYGGAAAPGALCLEEGITQVFYGEKYWMKQIDERWWEVRREKSDKTQECEIMIAENAYAPNDFISLNFFAYRSPLSHFYQERVVNLRTEKGSYSITGDLFKQREAGKVQESRLETKEEREACLARYFGITVLDDVECRDRD